MDRDGARIYRTSPPSVMNTRALVGLQRSSARGRADSSASRGMNGGKRVERNFSLKGIILEIDLRQRIRTGEYRGSQAAEPGYVVRAGSTRGFIGRQDACLRHSDYRFGAARLAQVDRKSARGRLPFVGPVEDLPVTKLAATAQTEAPRRYATQRERYHRKLSSAEHAGI